METRKSAEELIADIGNLIREGWAFKDNPEQLSKNLYDIAALNWALGTWLVEFEEIERGMKAELELDKANNIQEFVDAGDAVNRAEVKTIIQLAPKRKEHNKMVNSIEKVKICMRSTQSVLDAIRSRLSLIKSELTNG